MLKTSWPKPVFKIWPNIKLCLTTLFKHFFILINSNKYTCICSKICPKMNLANSEHKPVEINFQINWYQIKLLVYNWWFYIPSHRADRMYYKVSQIILRMQILSRNRRKCLQQNETILLNKYTKMEGYNFFSFRNQWLVSSFLWTVFFFFLLTWNNNWGLPLNTNGWIETCRKQPAYKIVITLLVWLASWRKRDTLTHIIKTKWLGKDTYKLSFNQNLASVKQYASS